MGASSLPPMSVSRIPRLGRLAVAVAIAFALSVRSGQLLRWTVMALEEVAGFLLFQPHSQVSNETILVVFAKYV